MEPIRRNNATAGNGIVAGSGGIATGRLGSVAGTDGRNPAGAGAPSMQRGVNGHGEQHDGDDE